MKPGCSRLSRRFGTFSERPRFQKVMKAKFPSDRREVAVLESIVRLGRRLCCGHQFSRCLCPALAAGKGLTVCDIPLRNE